MTADNLRLMHPDSGDFLSIVNRRKDGDKGVALAATRTADFAEPCKRTGGHEVRMPPGLVHQRSGAGDDRDEHTCAYGSAARSPESTCSSRDLASSAYHLAEGLWKVNLPTGVMVGSQECCADHDMMLRAVHMAERHIHHLSDDFYRVA